MNLKKFKDLAQDKNKRNIAICIFLFIFLIGGILLYRSYAYYEEEKTFNVLQGVVPDFVKTEKLNEYLINKSNKDTTIEKVSHEATEQTPRLTDYRFTGANPNNYVYFGCSDNCTEDNLYRIIGVIPTQSTADGEYENRVKLIKANYYMEEESGLLLNTNASYSTPEKKGYKWNSSNNNDWEESSLQKDVLNGIFWNSLGEYQKYIESTKWYLGAIAYNPTPSYTPDQFYTFERSNTRGFDGGFYAIEANIGLIYPSDYGYAIGSTYREKSIYNNREEYVSNAWIYTFEHYEWTISPIEDYTAIYAYRFDPSGYVTSWSVYPSEFIFGIRPTFFLKSNVLKTGGNGTISNPYRLSIEPEPLNEYLINKSNTDTTIEKIEHEATEQTPALTDYRFTGADPNNYVYFGCEENCTEDNLYRIIGVIPTQSTADGEYGNRVKLIKANYYTETSSGLSFATNDTPEGIGYQWNSSANNQWQASTLQNEVLNGIYWSSLEEYQKYINPVVWYLGSANFLNFNTYTSDQFYNFERSNTKGYSGGATSMTANIGLMYPSDYGYSIGSGYRGENVYNNAGKYVYNAWLYNLESKYCEWVITPESNNGYIAAFGLKPDGYLGDYSVGIAGNMIGVRPTFFLKTDVLLKYGNGTIEHPYRIAIS